jgi:hypothetical protein
MSSGASAPPRSQSRTHMTPAAPHTLLRGRRPVAPYVTAPGLPRAARALEAAVQVVPRDPPVLCARRTVRRGVPGGRRRILRRAPHQRVPGGNPRLPRQRLPLRASRGGLRRPETCIRSAGWLRGCARRSPGMRGKLDAGREPALHACALPKPNLARRNRLLRSRGSEFQELAGARLPRQAGARIEAEAEIPATYAVETAPDFVQAASGARPVLQCRLRGYRVCRETDRGVDVRRSRDAHQL